MDPFYRRFFPADTDAVEGYHAELRKHLPDRGRVLDLGCGDLSELEPYRTERREIWGADFQTHPEMEDSRWFRTLGAGGSIPFDDATFDLVTACWVLEHVSDPGSFLAEVRRVLRPGGWFVGLTVDARHYVAWIRRAVGLLPHTAIQQIVRRLYGRACHDTFPTRYRINTPDRLRRRGSAQGLRLDRVVRFANPDYFSFSPPLRRAAVVTDFLLERITPGLGRLYLVAALEKAGPTTTRVRTAA